MNARYAIYYIPEPETALANLGSALLGRDSETGYIVAQPVFSGFSQERVRTLTADARLYGLHATLKAPFFLKEGMTELGLLLAAANFVQGREAILLPRLELARPDSFFALAPSGGTPEERKAAQDINALAAEAVSLFDPFRAAPSEQEIARRHQHTLSTRQRALLAKWGYPHVFDEYHFHITLTGRLHEGVETLTLEERLRAYFTSVCAENMAVSSICVCKQTPHGNDCDFTLLKRFHFSKI